MEAESNAEELPLSSITTVEQLAESLRRLHLRAGERSLRELERWAHEQQRAGRPAVQLTRTTVSEVLGGRRTPSPAFLISFLEACGVNAEDRRPWLEARARVADRPRRADASSSPGADGRDAPAGRPEPEESAPAGPAPDNAVTRPTRRRPRLSARRLVLVTAVGLLAVVLAVVAATRDSTVSTTLACVPVDCTAGREITLSGRVSGPLPEGRELHVLIRVESTKRWYLGPGAVPRGDGTWSQRFQIGSDAPQRKDRHFTLCAVLLPATSLAALSALQERYAGSGLATGELPAERVELACIPAVRQANR